MSASPIDSCANKISKYSMRSSVCGACNNDSLVYFYALRLCGRGGGNRYYDGLDW